MVKERNSDLLTSFALGANHWMERQTCDLDFVRSAAGGLLPRCGRYLEVAGLVSRVTHFSRKSGPKWVFGNLSQWTGYLEQTRPEVQNRRRDSAHEWGRSSQSHTGHRAARTRAQEGISRE